LDGEFWSPFFTKSILEKLTDQIGDPSTSKYIFDKAWLAQRRVPPANTSVVKLGDGLSFDAPVGAQASGTSTSVTVTSSGLGTVQIDDASPQTAAQAQSSQQRQPGQPPLTPDPPVMTAPDWVLSGGGTLISQRTINGKTYRCSATGLTAAQLKNARLACRGLRAS
jgi:hypothetical protein